MIPSKKYFARDNIWKCIDERRKFYTCNMGTLNISIDEENNLIMQKDDTLFNFYLWIFYNKANFH